ncbi:Pantothenate precursors transporter PanS [Zhongshania aliphaticivorans]|uniref:Pantothenates transporter PanS n=1 Tax=Zhongshania aliphaticivorans TaxID=1470434 RepID=A0A5S9N9C2_9GAMM|nr:bile acid:sodium symporter family protein [Zhongshania aliphaticivorans]CAA0080686.1 Pantothenate precursors transporter PanS [Zhongshania aliphaticivorans]CAA0085588.1 Pantothenate precursors transporter PanS [Zhongshania aliphaticivorans]
MEQNVFIDIGLPVSLFIIMIGMGLGLTVDDFVKEARHPRASIVGSIGQLLLLPALGFLLAWGLTLPPAIAVGLVILAACPGGATSNVITYLAKGNVALSIVITAIASVATIVTLPLLVNQALSWQFGRAANVSMPVVDTIAMLVIIVLLPTGIGMLVRAKAPMIAAKSEKAFNGFGAVVLLSLIVLISYGLRDQLVGLLVQAGPACLLLNVLGIGVGLLSARLSGVQRADQLAIAVELGIKNSTIGILLATTILHSQEMAIPSMVYGLTMYLFGAGLVAYGRATIVSKKS